jgi:hypothetical protein
MLYRVGLVDGRRDAADVWPAITLRDARRRQTDPTHTLIASGEIHQIAPPASVGCSFFGSCGTQLARNNFGHGSVHDLHHRQRVSVLAHLPLSHLGKVP